MSLPVTHYSDKQRLLRRLFGYMSSTSESGTTSDDNDPPAADAYTEEMDRHTADLKGKGQAKR